MKWAWPERLATVIAFGSSIVLAFYWYFVKRDMYLKIGRSDLKYSPAEMKSVLKVGLPEATELSVMNIFNVFLNFFVIAVAGTVGGAMYSTGWRVVYLLMIPAQAVRGAIVSVCPPSTEGAYAKIVRLLLRIGRP